MTRFDQLLRRGLMDANLTQYEKVLQDADSIEPDFSPAYLRERMRMLADPWGWMKRRNSRGQKRVNWRLIALIAALLLLSACAYAVVTGQFSQWFPGLGTDPAVPEASEDVMSRMGTVIEETRTVNGETLTLNSVVWDGNFLLASITAEVPELPEEAVPDAQIAYGECRLELSESQKEEYVRKDLGDYPGSQEELEEEMKFLLDMGEPFFQPDIRIAGREGDTMLLQLSVPLSDFVERPEFALHIENITIPGENGGESGVSILKGPYDFNFTAETLIPPVSYTGEVQTAVGDIQLRLTRIDITVLQMYVDYEVLSYGALDPDAPDDLLSLKAAKGLQGLWTADGRYVDCSGADGTASMVIDRGSQKIKGSAGRLYPHVIDPATVTAVDIDGTRVELAGWRRLQE